MTYLIVQEFFFPASFSRSPLPSSSSFRVGICRKHRKTKRVEGERTREREREREKTGQRRGTEAGSEEGDQVGVRGTLFHSEPPCSCYSSKLSTHSPEGNERKRKIE